jgi:hypothetical protein
VESAPPLRPSNVPARDERERDWRPGRFAVRGPFIDLSKMDATFDEAESESFDRRGA